MARYTPVKTPEQERLSQIREECRKLVRKRALVSAGAAVVPIPFLDVVVDASILMQLIPEISQQFNLHQEAIDQMDAERREKTLAQIRTRGSQLLGIVITRAIVKKSFETIANRMVAKQVIKFIPFGGQLLAAGMGYFVMRKMAYQHIEDCYAVAAVSG